VANKILFSVYTLACFLASERVLAAEAAAPLIYTPQKASDYAAIPLPKQAQQQKAGAPIAARAVASATPAPSAKDKEQPTANKAGKTQVFHTGATPAATHKAGEPIPLHQIVEEALVATPEIAIAKERVIQAEAGLDEAIAPFRPQVDLRSVLSREYNNPFRSIEDSTVSESARPGYSTSQEYGLTVRQNLYDGGSKSAALEERLASRTVVKRNQAKIFQEVAIRTTASYINVWRLQDQLKSVNSNLVRLRRLHSILQSRVRQGDASEAESTYMAGRILGLEQQVKGIEASLEEAWIALGRYTGARRQIDAVLPYDMYQISIPDQKAFEDALIQNADQNNISLRIAREEIEVLKYRKISEYGKSRPTVDALVEGNRAKDVGGNTGMDKLVAARLQLNFRLYDGGLNAAGQRRLASQIRAAGYEFDTQKQDMLQALRKALSDISNLSKQIVLSEQEYKAHTELYTAYEKQFKLGDLDLIVIADNIEKIQQASLRRSMLQSDYAFAVIEVLYQTGQAERYLRSDNPNARTEILQNLGFSVAASENKLPQNLHFISLPLIFSRD